MKHLLIRTLLYAVAITIGFFYGQWVTERKFIQVKFQPFPVIGSNHGIWTHNTIFKNVVNGPVKSEDKDPIVRRGNALMRQSEWHKSDEVWAEAYRQECRRLRDALTALRIENATASGTLVVYSNATFKMNEDFWRTNAGKFIVVKNCEMVGGSAWYPTESQGTIQDSVFVGKHPDDKE